MIKSEDGYLILADVSGYTAYLTEAEQEHAGPIIISLLSSVIDNAVAPLVLSNLEGDAIFLRAPADGFVGGQTFLEVIENIYFAFTELREQMIANTSCSCRACSKIPELDLKVIIHKGTFQILELAGRQELSGPDVILVHRLAKSGVGDHTQIPSYAMFTAAAAEALDLATFAPRLVPYGEDFEHFGHVETLVHDLKAAWEQERRDRAPVVVAPEDAAGYWEIRLQTSMPLAWDLITLPQHKKVWMGMLDVTREDDQGGRLGVGAAMHCAHEAGDFRYTVIDWRPFQYYSCLERDPFSSLKFYSTYSLKPDGGGTLFGFTMGQPFAEGDMEDTAIAEATQNIVGIYEQVIPMMFQKLADLVRTGAI